MRVDLHLLAREFAVSAIESRMRGSSRELISSLPVADSSVTTMLAAYDELMSTWGDLMDDGDTLLAVIILSLGCIGILDKETLLKKSTEKLMQLYVIN